MTTPIIRRTGSRGALAANDVGRRLVVRPIPPAAGRLYPRAGPWIAGLDYVSGGNGLIDLSSRANCTIALV